MQKFLFTITGFVLALLIVLPIWQPWEIYQAFDNKITIEEVGEKAFNLLPTNSNSNSNEVSEEDKTFAYSSFLANQNITYHKYVYEGDLDIPLTNVEVLKRIKGSENNFRDISQLIKDFSFGLLDLTKLRNPTFQSFNITERGDFSYNVFIDANDGSITINQNQDEWPDVYADCAGDKACIDSLCLTAADILSEAELISIADEFLQTYEIDIASYGKPFANNSWKRSLTLKNNPEDYCYPETLSVIYPLQIDGKIVYSQGGDYDGIQVRINTREKRVSGVWKLSSQHYQSSTYQAANDLTQVARFIEKGGLYGIIPENPQQVIEIPLQNPEIVWMRYYHYVDSEEEGDELVIPALRLEVGEFSSEDFSPPEAILIPLVKSVLDEVEELQRWIKPMWEDDGNPKKS